MSTATQMIEATIAGYTTENIVTMIELLEKRIDAGTATVTDIQMSTTLGCEIEVRWGIDYDDVEAMYSNGFTGSDLDAYRILSGN